MSKYLIVIAGATASGKTSLGIRLAQKYDTVILSADSRQFYQEMSILLWRFMTLNTVSIYLFNGLYTNHFFNYSTFSKTLLNEVISIKSFSSELLYWWIKVKRTPPKAIWCTSPFSCFWISQHPESLRWTWIRHSIWVFSWILLI